MNSHDQFLYNLRLQGIDISSEGTNLNVKSAQSKLTDALLNTIKSQKSQLIEHLNTSERYYYPLSSLQKRLCQSSFSSKGSYLHNLYSLISLTDEINSAL